MFSESSMDAVIRRRREWVFLLLSGIFLGSLTMLNILGISRFIDLSEYLGIKEESQFRIMVAVGVLPYPITFLCTDIISEIYGRHRANMLVWVGFVLNLWVMFVLWFGGWLNAPAELTSSGALPVPVIDGSAEIPHGFAFYEIRKLTFGATFASMIAYLAAQFVDVHLFHYIKKKTNGTKLWLRNNVSTMMSQMVDSVAVILITHYYANALPIPEGMSVFNGLLLFILSSYAFKFIFALLDTIPIYIVVAKLRKYLHVKDEIH